VNADVVSLVDWRRNAPEPETVSDDEYPLGRMFYHPVLGPGVIVSHGNSDRVWFSSTDSDGCPAIDKVKTSDLSDTPPPAPAAVRYLAYAIIGYPASNGQRVLFGVYATPGRCRRAHAELGRRGPVPGSKWVLTAPLPDPDAALVAGDVWAALESGGHARRM
jgi:hypothetical protein